MIEVRNLTKSYNVLEKPVVKNVSLCARPGEITILLGPNGAGKSTTIKSIANLLNYEGEILICGHPNNTIEAKKCFSYVPEIPMLYDVLTVDETIEFIGRAYRVKNYKEIADKYLEAFTMSIMWVLMRIAVPSARSCRKSSNTSSILAGSNPTIGSSTNNAFVSIINAKIMLNFCRIPLLSSFANFFLFSDIVNDIWDRAYIMNRGEIVKEIDRKDAGEETLKEIFFETTREGDV